MARIAVTGAAGRLGAKVVALLAERHDVDALVGIDLRPLPAAVHEPHQLDLATADPDALAKVLAGCDAVLHLASVFGQVSEGPEVVAGVEIDMVRAVLAAADAAGCPSLVVMSSATVYGPWANNPVPLTEDQALRPHPDLAVAVQKAEVERLVADWAADHPHASAACLRPVTVVQDGQHGWLAEALQAASGLPTGDEPPAQYLHLDDLASAVVAAWAHRLRGPVNVAPSGWLTTTERRALDPVLRLRLPEPAAVWLSNVRWKLGLAPTSPGILAYARHPWVVANDRLLATGWSPGHSNEEAYVAGHEARAIESISPQRRQEIALAAVGVGLSGAVAGAVALVRRSRRRAG